MDTPVGRLPFVTTQLSSAPGQSGLRCAQVRSFAEVVATPATGRTDRTLPPILTGDLNGASGRRRDPAEPSSRIDYVLSGCRGPAGTARVVGVGLLGERPHDGTWPSDHPGVVADLLLGPPLGPEPDVGPPPG